MNPPLRKKKKTYLRTIEFFSYTNSRLKGSIVGSPMTTYIFKNFMRSLRNSITLFFLVFQVPTSNFQGSKNSLCGIAAAMAEESSRLLDNELRILSVQ